MVSNSRVNEDSKLTERQKLENEIRELSKKAPVFEIKSKEDFEKFFDEEFDDDILKDLIDQGYTGKKLIDKFEKTKKKLSVAMDKLIDEAENEKLGVMSKEEFEKEIGLQYLVIKPFDYLEKITVGDISYGKDNEPRTG